MSSTSRVPTAAKRPGLFWGIIGVGSVAALAITQMGFHAQDRQYKKTLTYMHDGKEKYLKQLDKVPSVQSSKTTIEGMGKEG